MNNTDDLYDDLQTEIRELQEQNEKLEAWIDDLQSGMYINCVYCGHRYGPNTPRVETTMRKALEEHIASCPKHPLSKAKSELEQARRERDEWKATAGHEADGLESWKKVAEKAEAELADLRGRMERIHDRAKNGLKYHDEFGIGCFQDFNAIVNLSDQAIKKAAPPVGPNAFFDRNLEAIHGAFDLLKKEDPKLTAAQDEIRQAIKAGEGK